MKNKGNSRYSAMMNSDKTDPSPIIQGLEGGSDKHVKEKVILFKGIEKILQNEENRLIQNDNIKNSN